MRSRRARGFTLIELVVVIATIAILASLLLPALTRARASAHSAKCKSNLRQLGLGLRMYVDDNAGYPQMIHFGAPWAGWALPLNQYLNQPLVQTNSPLKRYLLGSAPWPAGAFLCPSDKRIVWHGTGGSYGYNTYGAIFASYPILGASTDQIRGGKNENLGLGGYGRFLENSGPTFPAPVRDSAVRVPSEMIALGDAYGVCYGMLDAKPAPRPLFDVYETFGDLAREQASHSPSSPIKATGQTRHQGRLNMAFCDGHVEALRVDDAYFGKRDRDMRMWNTDNEPQREFLGITK